MMSIGLIKKQLAWLRPKLTAAGLSQNLAFWAGRGSLPIVRKKIAWLTAKAKAGGGATDADAIAFLTAAAITDPTITRAIDALVIAIKAISSGDVWTNKLKVIYPFAGGAAVAHAVNLRQPGTFDASMVGGLTHTSDGVTGDGLSGYILTGFNQSVHGAEDDEHISVYSRTDLNLSRCDIGVSDGSSGSVLFSRSSGSLLTRSQSVSSASTASANSLGYFSVNRTGSAGYRQRQNATNTNITQASDLPLINTDFAVLARNNVALGPQLPSSRNLAWAAIGRGLTEVEDADLYAAVQAFQTALSRNV